MVSLFVYLNFVFVRSVLTRSETRSVRSSPSANPKARAPNRIGPLNIDILSIIFGSLLGKGEAEKRKDGSRIIFNYKDLHLNYPLTLHNLLYTMEYCSYYTPIISKQLGKKSKIYKTMRFTTWTYTSFD